MILVFNLCLEIELNSRRSKGLAVRHLWET